MKRYLLIFLIALICFFVIDVVWLAYLGRAIYVYFIGDFLRSPPLWSAALLFYILFIIGMMVFCIVPAINQQSRRYAVLYGGFYGFITYMTYELTNFAVIANWPVGIVPIDIAWGTFLSASISLLTTVIYLRFFGKN
tara:strand:- start:4572 stop:4982 length:411 start_codon:yes stop_codon:yes gene_type:complete